MASKNAPKTSSSQQAREMSADLVFGAEQIFKSYSLTRSPLRRLVENLFALKPVNQKRALAPLSLCLKQGQSIGLVGKNGAGKSTLLQIAAGVLTPSGGSLKKQGRVAALLELGAGLLPDLTGRENIRFAGPLWGLSQVEIEQELQAIIDFSELGNAIDEPLRTYSSGMIVRLAFSLATISKPALLIIDEALSVGDGQFAQKSFDRIMQLKKTGTSLLFCSHSLYQVEMLCERAIWLDEGQCMAEGAAPDVCRQYRNFLDRQSLPPQENQPRAAQTPVNKPTASLRSIKLLRNGNLIEAPSPISLHTTSLQTAQFISRQDSLGIEIAVCNPGPPGKTAHLAILIKDEMNRVVSSLSTQNDALAVQSPGERGVTTLMVNFEKLALLKGVFRIDVILMCNQAVRFIEAINDALTFEVIQSDKEIGVVSLNHEWQQRIETQSWAA